MTDKKPSATQKIFASVEENKQKLEEILTILRALEKRVTESDELQSVRDKNVLTKLDSLEERVAAAAKGRATTTRRRATGTTAAGVTPKMKPHRSSLYWFKDEMVKNRDETVAKFCTTEMMEDLTDYISSDATIQKLEEGSEPRLKKEAAFLWNKYVKAAKKGTPEAEEKEIEAAKDELRKRIKAAFDNYKAEFTSSNNTPATKE